MKLDFDEAAVARLLPMAELIPAMAEALAAFSSGQVAQPTRVTVPVDAHHGFFAVMPAATANAMGVKLVTFYPENQRTHTHHAVILLFRPETGEPLASLDGRLITEMRTAAVSAVATDLLARPEAKVLALLGSGVQARSHLEALRLVRPIDEVRVWSPRRAAEFAATHAEAGVVAVPTAEEAVRDADIIVTVTSAKTPILQGAWLKPGAHINAVGAARPEWRELDDAVLSRSTIYVDSMAGALAESGDMIAAKSFAGELGAVVNGVVPGRTDPGQITLFKSLGMAIEDVAAAELVLRRAAEQADGW